MYIQIGTVLAVLGCCFLLAAAISYTRNRKRPLYRKKMPKKAYAPAFIESISRAYFSAGDIRGMLNVLSEKWKGGTAGKRIPAALSYIEGSRYRDYETALFLYLSDGSTECDQVLEQILQKEILKQRGLICKKTD